MAGKKLFALEALGAVPLKTLTLLRRARLQWLERPEPWPELTGIWPRFKGGKSGTT